MKRLLFLLALAAVSATAPLNAASDAEVAARKLALEIAGAFSNDGFKLRDGNWCGKFEPGKPALVQVNLYAGNQYWFTVGAGEAAKKVAVTVFDETGKPVATEPYADASVAAAGFAPKNSGPYYLRVEVTEGGPSAFCLIYSYR
ncbi:MAG: hypothetical protein K8R23_18285 [Chthoniobacter sp.]|nr:hypothetical protein [Chthoniobacter sp.]